MYDVACSSAGISKTVFHLQYMETKTMKLRNVIFDKVFLQSVKFAERENGGIEGTRKIFFF